MFTTVKIANKNFCSSFDWMTGFWPQLLCKIFWGLDGDYHPLKIWPTVQTHPVCVVQPCSVEKMLITLDWKSKYTSMRKYFQTLENVTMLFFLQGRKQQLFKRLKSMWIKKILKKGGGTYLFIFTNILLRWQKKHLTMTTCSPYFQESMAFKN